MGEPSSTMLDQCDRMCQMLCALQCADAVVDVENRDALERRLAPDDAAGCARARCEPARFDEPVVVENSAAFAQVCVDRFALVASESTIDDNRAVARGTE